MTDYQYFKELLSLIPVNRLEKLKMLPASTDSKLRKAISKRIIALEREKIANPLSDKAVACTLLVENNCYYKELNHE